VLLSIGNRTTASRLVAGRLLGLQSDGESFSTLLQKGFREKSVLTEIEPEENNQEGIDRM
jgi:hypothetical protein